MEKETEEETKGARVLTSQVSLSAEDPSLSACPRAGGEEACLVRRKAHALTSFSTHLTGKRHDMVGMIASSLDFFKINAMFLNTQHEKVMDPSMRCRRFYPISGCFGYSLLWQGAVPPAHRSK